jgi:hypothetical protein
MAQSNRLRSIAEGDTALFGDPADEAVPNQSGQPTPAPRPTRLESAATTVLLTALRALSQRTLIALANLFVLATAISAWWLWMVTMPSPSVLQLVGLALYGTLILLLNWLVLRRR